MLASMDSAAATAGPWLALGVVLGVLLAGVLALGVASVRRTERSSDTAAAPLLTEPEPDPPIGWVEDDLPGFLDRPPGVAPEATRSGRSSTEDPPLARPHGQAVPATARAATPDAGRVLLVLATVAVLLVGIAAGLAAVTTPGAATGAEPTEAADPRPTWDVPDLAAVPDRPEPGDPGAGRLAAASVPIGDDGALVRLTFQGLVLERRAVGVTVAYPSVSVSAVEVPGGPALAHVRLPLWNCLSDTAPDDPVAAGCRRLPPEYAELPTPALTIGEHGDGLRISGRFATYVRPAGSPPEWTGRVYPLTVHVQPDGDEATGTLHLGTERAAAVDDPRLNDFRRGR